MITHQEKGIEFSQKVCLLFLTFLTILVGYPLAILVFVPVLSYRSIIEHFLPKLDPRFGTVLKGFGAIFSARTPYTNPTTVLLPFFYLDKRLDKDHLAKLFTERIMNLQNKFGDSVYIQLRQKIARKLGYNFWLNVTNFDLCHHIKYLNESDPERLVKDSEVLDLTLHLSKLPFNSKRSPCEILVIPICQHENDPQVKSALIFRFHHCLADGFSILQIFLRLGEKPIPLEPKGSKTKTSTKLVDTYNVVVNQLRFLIEGPYQALKLIIFSNDNNQWLQNVVQRPSGKYSAQQYDFPLSTLKKIRDERSLGVATIMITMLMQATARVMQRKNLVGNKVKLHTLLPFPLPSRPDGVGNHYTFAKMPVDVDVNDVMATARSVNLEYGRLKQSVTFSVLAVITNLIACLPVEWIPQSDNVVQSTCLFSNFPGPFQPVDIAGCELREAFVSGSPAKGCAVASLALSYCGRVRFLFGGDQTNIAPEDADLLKEEIVNVLNELSEI